DARDGEIVSQDRTIADRAPPGAGAHGLYGSLHRVGRARRLLPARRHRGAGGVAAGALLSRIGPRHRGDNGSAARQDHAGARPALVRRGRDGRRPQMGAAVPRVAVTKILNHQGTKTPRKLSARYARKSQISKRGTPMTKPWCLGVLVVKS